MRARLFLGAAILGAMGTGGCTSAEFATAANDEDSGATVDSTTADSIVDGGVDSALGDANVGDALPPVDSGVEASRPDTRTPTCSGSEKFVPSTLPIGAAPVVITTGDLDENGTIDLVVASGAAGTVTALLGHGDGKFDVQAGLSFGANLSSVILADLDGDKHLDIAATSLTDNSVGVRLGLGTGKFGPALLAYKVGSAPTSLAAGKLNGDSRIDLVVTSGGDSMLNVMINTPGSSGKLEFDFTDYPVGINPTDVVITDLTKDGPSDFVVVNGGADSLATLTGKGDGTWLPYVPITSTFLKSPRRLVMADFTGGGRLDIAVTSQAGPNVAIFPALGTGAFGAPKEYPAGFDKPIAIAFADFDGDGHKDLVAGSDTTIGLFDVGSLSPATVHVTVPGSGLATGDFNGDGKPDIAAGNSTTSSVTILLACH